MLYINPRATTKEQWLTENATQVTEDRVKNFDFEAPADDAYYPCIWVDNGSFTAAGVAIDAAEQDRWFATEDTRLKTYWLVKKEVLFDLHPEYREATEQQG